MTDFAVAIAILAGGQSRRMGRDKAKIVIDGLPLLERTAQLALSVSPQVLVIGRTPPDDWPLPKVIFLEDEHPEQGPLGGLATALRHRGDSAVVLLLACDMPALTVEALLWLLESACMLPDLADGVVAVNDSRREPLFALYTQNCLALVEQHLIHGQRSLQALLKAGKFISVAVPAHFQSALANINTPEELNRWHQSGERRP